MMLEKIGLELAKSLECLKAAEVLLQENLYNASISRSYYAMFHAAKAALLLSGIEPKTHEGVINHFGLHLVKTGSIEEAFGRSLSTLRFVWEKGDYDVYVFYSQEDAKARLAEAGRFVERVKRYLTEHGFEAGS